ncbi:MAG TPA: TolC family protein [Candidatus Acidoferrales bacterium]|nr:TolC family protein [Candidatus Acidoferrales bacterium]
MKLRFCLLAVASVVVLRSQQPAMRLTLAEAQREAIANNPQFSAARLNAAAAYQVPLEYKANYEPNLIGSLTTVGADNGSRLAAGGLNNPIVYNRIGSGLTVGQMITDFGRTGNLVGMAKLRAEAQDQVTETTRAQILLAVSRAYFGLLRAQAVVKVADQTVAARQSVVDQVTALAESKLKSTLDVSFANVNLSDAKLIQIQAQNDLKAADAELATAMGLPGQSGFILAEEGMPGPLPDRVTDLVHDALQSRPELRDLRLEQGAAERFARAEHALYYPSLGVVGTAGFVPAGYEAVPSKYGAIGVNVTIPIFNGGLFKARQTEAELKAKAATQNVSDLENRVTRDVRVAFLNANTAYDRMAVTKQLLDQARQALDLAQTRYDFGLGNIVELSTAELNLTSAQIADANARYDYQTQRVVLDYQVGVLR